ncbi:M90 family metallopeptidase [Paucibacter soli]|uniref:M90 family metallopeptidase n=1 Tax=Paucibacter soli TaxID=3133433 RepID=UPI003097FB27
MLGAWWRRWRARHERQIPEPVWQLTLARYPFIAARSVSELSELRQLCSQFLARKEFHGVAGFQVSDEVAVAVAAQACLPVLRLGLDWYDDFVGIVMHAHEVVAAREFMDEDGVVHEYDEVLAGEAMEGGPLMLAWSELAPEPTALTACESVYNVVIHEFAHVLDMRDGIADGVPPQGSAAARAQWLRVLDAEWLGFCERVDAGEATLIDPYGAEAIEEFFAVASEAFFVAPRELLDEQPVLYRLLSGFYRQDPAG